MRSTLKPVWNEKLGQVGCFKLIKVIYFALTASFRFRIVRFSIFQGTGVFILQFSWGFMFIPQNVMTLQFVISDDHAPPEESQFPP